MAEYLPLILNTGSITTATSRYVINPIYHSASLVVSRSFQTTLPDPYYFQTSSADLTDNGNEATSQSVFTFTAQTLPEQYYYLTNAILGVRSAATATGVRIGMTQANTADGFFVVKTGAVSLTAFTYRFQGSADAFAFVAAGTTTATNTTYPAYIQGVLNNSSTTGDFRNTVLFQSETNQIVTTASGSIFYNKFAGYSSSLNPTQSSFPLIATSSGLSVMPVGNTITQSVIFPTASRWISQSLAANVTNGLNATYNNIFTLTGLTTGQRYLVNFYLIASSPLTTTGVQLRAVTGSAYRGTIYSPTSATAFSIQNSADGNNITNNSTAWQTNNAKRLAYGEYTFVKGATDPAIQLRTEVSGSIVTIFSGSVVFYRPID